MEIVTELVNNQLALYIPVALVILTAILVFTFGFKSAEQPPFDKLTTDDRKSLNKKRKIKEKKTTANGHVSTGESKSEKSPQKENKRSPAKEPDSQKSKDKKSEPTKLSDKNKKPESTRVKIDEIKLKKTTKKSIPEKPVDFDDGGWETVPTKADKKKKQDSPVKKDKKLKKTDKVEIEKVDKDAINSELREQEKEVTVEKLVDEILKADIEIEEPVAIIEEPVAIIIETEKKIENKIKQKDETPEEVEKVNEEPVAVVEEKKEKKKEKKVKKDVVKSKDIEIVPLQSDDQSPTKSDTQTRNEIIIKSEAKMENAKAPEAPNATGVAFDELGDTWTEAKAAKKSKKKARKDN